MYQKCRLKSYSEEYKYLTSDEAFKVGFGCEEVSYQYTTKDLMKEHPTVSGNKHNQSVKEQEVDPTSELAVTKVKVRAKSRQCKKAILVRNTNRIFPI